jgi:general secretion pathway protein M
MSARWTAGRATWRSWFERPRVLAQPLLARVQSIWHGLSPRERLQVGAMVAVVLAALCWLAFTKPALDTLAHWDEALPKLRSQAVALKEVLADTNANAVPGDSSLGPAERVRASLEAAGLAGAYELREVDATLRLAFTGGNSSRAIDWLLGAPAPLGLKVQQVTLQRSDGKGPADDGNGFGVQATLIPQQQSGKGS